MKEIGGFLEFERYTNKQYHDKLIKLNSGRNCLAYVINAENIKEIFLPYYICDAVIDVCKNNNVKINYYHIDSNFEPIDADEFKGSWVYIVNYYGLISNKRLKTYIKNYNVILDYAQSFFKKPLKNSITLYTCRKFFGVPDGAYLQYGGKILELEKEISYDKMEHILGRFDICASEFYGRYVENEKNFENKPIKEMSCLTENILKSIDYKRVKNIRTRNFNYLLKNLKNINKLKVCKVKGAFGYPLLIDGGEKLKRELIKNKIYIPTLWPNVEELVNTQDFEYELQKNLILIPCDQRYFVGDMEHIVRIIQKNKES